MMDTCINPKCKEKLTRLKVTPGQQGWGTDERTGQWLCPSCRYMGKWAFAACAGLVGAIYGVLKLLAKLWL